MSVDDTTVSFSLGINLDQAMTNVRKLQMVVYRTIGLFRRLGLPEPIDRAIAKVQQFIMIANEARLTIIALNAAMATTPFGWLLFGLSAATLAFDVGSFIQDLG